MRVASIGAACAAGIGIAPISAALRGTVSAFALEPSFPRFTNGTPMTLASAEPLDIHVPWQDRLHWLVDQALAPLRQSLETVVAAAWDSVPPHLPLLVSLPPNRPAVLPDTANQLVRRISGALPLPLDRGRSVMVRSGHDGALCCLGVAARLLAVDQPAAVVVGGVDSWISIEALHWLEAQRRLKGADVPNGVVPGEGAAFLLLVNDALASRVGLQAGASVLAQARAVEPNPWYEQRPNLAEGLTRALRSLLERPEHRGLAAGTARTDLTLGDLNGEPWRAQEWAFAYLRTQALHSEPLNLWHPADLWGDTGAAAGALLTALAAYELSRDPLLERVVLFSACDVTPYRSAALLAASRGMTT
jgi:3-oxoacyl-[acyl-carrier-protein] synthase-1